MFRLVRLAVVLCFAVTASAADPPVQLLLPSRVLQPDSTFELRFASEMVPADQIGQAATTSPMNKS